ncbi:carboxypeptidase-like regulatory domain-containing protein [Desertivirga brevis]|uniref:carboxypeptidase-like regulatory domain-containing protein n=1 Tax=Desertivirga brevis TaxID=2810310 RepID=UPI001A9783FA|nr:carboxypeptidase-like regulatory domain-containing protein [Pedobacter sp. SYSU D00873]
MLYEYKKILSTLLLISSSILGYAQSDSIDLNSIIDKKVKLSTERPVEKIYMHFDKPYYAVGDTIWFKAYLTMDQHVPSTLSKVVNVDFLTETDSVANSLKLAVNNSVASGSIVLSPPTYKQGNYRIRAYTTWMFNFKDDYFFHKSILVGDAIQKQLATNITFSDGTDRGGKTNARISFRDDDGKPYANKKVNWKVNLGYETVSKGKVETDASGFATISIPEYKKGSLREGSLITSIEVNNARQISSSFKLNPAYPKNDIQFFPEGGQLLEGIPTKVAFKAIKATGLGIDVKGNVTDNSGSSVSEFNSQHLGMGSLIITPEAGKTYTANVTFADGSKSSYPLPAVVGSGITIKHSPKLDTTLNFRIYSSNNFLETNRNKTFYVIAQSSGIVMYAAKLRLVNQVTSVAISTSKFPSGIIQLSILSAAGEPLTERLAFVYRKEELSIKVKTDKQVYAARQKVSAAISSLADNKPAEGHFSISVIDETRVPVDENAETTILSSLLLSSDLKGYIEKPNYYFTNINESKIADLDALLLTQGYRGYSYKEIISNSVPRASFPPEQGISLSGTLRYNNGMPVSKGNIRLIIPDKSFGVSAVTTADGRFRFDNVAFADSSKITISAVNNVNSKNMVITMDGIPYPSIAANVNSPELIMNIDSALNTYLQHSKREHFDGRLLQEVVIKAKAYEKKSSHMDYTALAGLSMMPNSQVSGERFKGCNNFLQCLQGSAMGLTFMNNEFYITRDYNAGRQVPVQIYVRDMPVDVNFLNSINPPEVESVEIFYNDGVSGINRRTQTNGVVVVNMKEIKKTSMSISQLKELFPDRNTLTYKPQGYAKVKQFYTPKYSVNPSSLNKADLRTTIYWNPAVTTDKAGNAVFEFFNSDNKGTFKAVVEGLDKDGRLGRAVYRYTVK